MCSLISWCATCGDHSALDPVPQARSAEYVCRRCNAAFLIEPAPQASPVPVAA